MSNRIAIIAAVALAFGAAQAASAAVTKKPTHVARAPSEASLQCSSEATSKGLHGKARTAFRHSCLHKANAHKPATKKIHPAVTHHKIDKAKKA